ncbi:hypothetical protein L226DRAFT_524144 [Lentinus tigrinus ALCF2SS1-7]|uniref:Uncharacterized protein n=1 Tax=Lentinus tigrinus ALCF2SS1-6 TaxID=1328759 RepID=A0A5C2S773_9APHY|nr:hypothetical protein L227DRAFT_564422 [Lentinus tigrinus ALCF2SS1-6]RPD73337.1 hypothetical protein L226DRAFT_524144 [Lentinus tigrinus ALCF2SS1-7]
MTLSEAFTHCQYIASKVLTLTPLPRLGAVAGWPDSELASAEEEVSVLHVQEEECEPWNSFAANEVEGQVATGYVDGTVSVYSYAPSPLSPLLKMKEHLILCMKWIKASWR